MGWTMLQHISVHVIRHAQKIRYYIFSTHENMHIANNHSQSPIWKIVNTKWSKKQCAFHIYERLPGQAKVTNEFSLASLESENYPHQMFLPHHAILLQILKVFSGLWKSELIPILFTDTE